MRAQSTIGADGFWQPATGSGSITETDASGWGYAANGVYSRPLDDGATLNGTWQAAGGTDGGYTMRSPSTLKADRSWTTTGAAVSNGTASGSWSYTGAGGLSASFTHGDPGNGGDSLFTLVVPEPNSQGWSLQYNVLSTPAANGMATTVATVGAAALPRAGAAASSSYASSVAFSPPGDRA